MTAALRVIEGDSPMPAPEVLILPTTDAHVRELYETARAKDREEVESAGIPFKKGLWRSYKRSLWVRTALIDGRVAAVWGCAGNYLGETGVPWLMTSYEIEKISPLKFAKSYQREVYEMLRQFPKLENMVLSSYDEAVRLMAIVGFELGPDEKVGQSMYRRFTMVRA